VSDAARRSRERRARSWELLPIAQRTEPAAAYFTIAESLTNVAKCAHATHATVAVRRGGGEVVVEVLDDGVGGAITEGGSRLRGLAARVEALDGHLRVWSPEGGGTHVRAEIPCA
jgi:signal transduction histidine kinase